MSDALGRRASLPGLHLGGLLRYLPAVVPEVDPDRPVEAQLLVGGRSNLSYLLSQAGLRLVLRRPPLGHVMPSAHDVAREYRVLSGLSRVGFPVPKPLAICEDASVIGAPFMLMEHVSGRVLATATDAAGLAPAAAERICASFVAQLARLHAVDPEAAGLADLGRPQGYVARQVRRWRDQWERTKTRDLSDLDRLASWLESQVTALPPDLPWSVVHGDYRLDNVILDPETYQVTAVLDWEMSTLGDPVADLAVSLVYWSRPGERLRQRLPVATGVTERPGFWERGELIAAYLQATGRDAAHLDTCLALACLKLAVIMESIHYRTQRGQQLGTAADDGVDMGAATEALATLGLAVAAGGGVAALSQ